MAKHPGGRPTKMTPEVINKLEEAFEWGCTDREACLHAGISPATLYNYCAENEKFLERKELLKESPLIKARRVVVNSLEENNEKTAQWVIEKKEGKAKQQTELSGPDGEAIKTDNKITIEFIDSYRIAEDT